MRRTSILDDREVSYFDAPGAGDARALVLLHAFPLSAEMWEPQLAGRRTGWRVIAPDLPGFGASAPLERGEVSDRARPNIDEYAAVVLRLLDRLGVGRAVVGGLSMGGYVALAMLRLAPARVAGLVLADTKAEADTDDARAGRDRLLATLDEAGLRGVADAMIPRLLGRTSRRSHPEVEARVRSIIEGGSAAGARGAIHRLKSRPDSTGLLRLIACPTLVIVGEEDEITPVEDARRLSGGIAGAGLEVVTGAGHLSSLEQPAAFNAAVDAFLLRQPPSAAAPAAGPDTGGSRQP